MRSARQLTFAAVAAFAFTAAVAIALGALCVALCRTAAADATLAFGLGRFGGMIAALRACHGG